MNIFIWKGVQTKADVGAASNFPFPSAMASISLGDWHCLAAVICIGPSLPTYSYYPHPLKTPSGAWMCLSICPGEQTSKSPDSCLTVDSLLSDFTPVTDRTTGHNFHFKFANVTQTKIKMSSMSNQHTLREKVAFFWLVPVTSIRTLLNFLKLDCESLWTHTGIKWVTLHEQVHIQGLTQPNNGVKLNLILGSTGYQKIKQKYSFARPIYNGRFGINMPVKEIRGEKTQISKLLS